MITEPDQIAQWFADAADLDPAPGGQGSLTFADRATSHRMTVKLTVAAAEPPHRLAFRWGYPEGEQPAEGNSTLVEFALTAEGGGTRLRLTETGFTALRRPDQDKAAYYEALDKGWDAHLASLHIQDRNTRRRDEPRQQVGSDACIVLGLPGGVAGVYGDWVAG